MRERTCAHDVDLKQLAKGLCAGDDLSRALYRAQAAQLVVHDSDRRGTLGGCGGRNRSAMRLGSNANAIGMSR